jgi:hypothetical protein
MLSRFLKQASFLLKKKQSFKKGIEALHAQAHKILA